MRRKPKGRYDAKGRCDHDGIFDENGNEILEVLEGNEKLYARRPHYAAMHHAYGAGVTVEQYVRYCDTLDFLSEVR